MKLLEEKVAIVTGAGGGLGRSHALALAAQGAKVVVNDPGVSRDGSGGTAKMADAVVEEIRKAGGQAVANHDSVATTAGAEAIVKTAVDAFGRIDILVNNAGILRDKTIHNMTDEMWDLVLAVHLRGTFACTRAAARVMKEKGTGGRIVNTTSVAGLKGNFGQSNYSAGKAGIYGFTLTAAMEFAKDGITVNAIAPLAKTRMTEDVESVGAELKPEDVSPVVLFLSSDLAKDVTGRIFGVHGKHLFEYRMDMTEGREKKEPWTVEEISEFVHAPPKAAAAPAAPTGGGNKIDALFKALPSSFVPEKAAGWETVIHFSIPGAPDWTVEVKGQKVRVAQEKPAAPTCVITVDADTMVGMIEGRVKGEMAFMSGKLKATKVPDLAKFGKAFDFKKLKEALDASGPAPQAAPAGGGNKIDALFKALPSSFVPERAAGWETVIHFSIPGAPDWTVEVKGQKVRVAQEKPAAPTSVITVDADTMVGMIEGRIKGEMAFMSGKLKATKVPDLAKFGKAFDFNKLKGALESGVPAAAPKASSGPIDLAAMLGRLPAQFQAEKALGFNGTLLFKVDGQAATVEIKDKLCAVKAPVPSPTCTLTTDAATLAAVLEGALDPQKAMTEGKIKATHLPSWLKFRQVFKFEPEKGLHRSLIGRRYNGQATLVRPEHLAAYDEAVGDQGSLIFPVALIKGLFSQFFNDPDFNGDLTRMVHGEQVMVTHRPLRAWDLVSPRGRVLGIEDKSSGQVLNFGQRLYVEGELAVEIESRLFFRGESKGEKSAAAPPAPKRSGEATTQKVVVAADLPKRYSGPSGDNNPIHLDEALAKSVGFKGVILQGLCTLALAARSLPKNLERLEVRFAKPVYPGDTLETTVWKKGTSLEFESVTQSGDVVLTNGRATVRGL